MVKTVGLYVDRELSYPADNFDPPQRYPEYPYGEVTLNPSNRVYAAVRELFRGMRLDEGNFGTPAWNPLGGMIRRGDKVAIKPNFVTDRHPAGYPGVEATVTSPSVLRAVIDYAFIATGPEGRITVVDAPLDVANFDKVAEAIGLHGMFETLRGKKGLDIRCVDLRRWWTHWEDTDVRRYDLPGDPHGYVIADLGRDSELLRGVDPEQVPRYRSTASYFEKRRMAEWHNLDHNLYSFSRTVMESDVLINMPKMKTHKKSGVTLSLKNIVGVTDAKDTLPHHRVGRPSRGGDEIAEHASLPLRLKAYLIDNVISSPYGLQPYKLLRPIYKMMRSKGVYRPEQRDRGEWFGNDSIWRTTIDLNKVLLYGDAEGKLHDTPQRKVISVVDGIVAGDGNGPINPTPVRSGFLVAGDDPVAVDQVCIRIMGLDWRKIPTYANIQFVDRYNFGCWDPGLIRVAANDACYTDMFSHTKKYHCFKPADGWSGEIEL